MRVQVTLALCALLIGAMTSVADANTNPATDGTNAYQFATPSRFEVFTEALVPTGDADQQETSALLSAIEKYRQGGNPLHTEALDQFLAHHPDSAWRVALLTNEGLAYAHSGEFSRAIDRLKMAWQAGQAAAGDRQRALAYRAYAELLHLHAAFGHADQVARLLAATRDDVLPGPARVARTQAQEELWNMRHQPRQTFICGLIALRTLLALQDDTSGIERLQNAEAGPHGISLTRLAALAGRAGLPTRMIRRAEDQPVPVPAIVHWKVGHYATIVGKSDGYFHVKDAAIGRDFWMTRKALNREASGYFLVPRQSAHNTWQVVSARQGHRVMGAGITSGNNPDATSNDDVDVCGCGGGGPSSGMPRYSVKAMLVSLSLHDTPVGYTPPVGPPVPVTLVYSQREANQPANFTFFNLGHKWTTNWLSYVKDNPRRPGSNVTIYLRGGGTRHFGGYNGRTGAFAPEERTGARLVQVSKSPVAYERRMPDGSKQIYSASDGSIYYPRRIFLTSIVDPAGNHVTLHYGEQMRLIALTDALGQKTTFQYGNEKYPLRITGVTDPFGRHATITYDASGRLVGITDVIGMESSFAYDGGTFIKSMTTPYGTTHFSGGQSGTTRWLEITDPEGHTQRIEYRHSAPGIPFSVRYLPSGIRTFNAYINSRNTFYWDETAMQRAPGDYSQARIYHWLHERGRYHSGLTAGVLESVKQPLERRVWFNYPSQSWAGGTGGFDKPSAIARVLEDGKTQLTRIHYNRWGKVAEVIDPMGRQVNYSYAENGIDVVKITRKTGDGYDVLAQFTWNDRHQPLTWTNAAGQITRFAYNENGQLTRRADALGHTTQYVYDDSGYLTRVIDANGEIFRSFTYDDYGRIAGASDSEGRTLQYRYDALDRLTRVIYPDGTDQVLVWDKLDPASYTDRAGRTTNFVYDSVRNLIRRIDPLGQMTRYGYYANGKLRTLTDANGNATAWTRDIEGRVTARIYPDGSRQTYAYDAIGRLKAKVDPKAQVTQYEYTLANRMADIAYAEAVNPTPDVHFTYGRWYPRITSMTDGHGTTSYRYYPAGVIGAGKLQAAQGESPHDLIQYAYDPLGRLMSRTVDGARETFGYDALSRLVRNVNSLGEFSFAYLGETHQPVRQTILGVPFRVAYQYEDNVGDRRLKAILSETLVHHQWRPVADYRFTTGVEGLVLSRSFERGKKSHGRRAKQQAPTKWHGRHLGWCKGRHRGWNHAPHRGVLKWLNRSCSGSGRGRSTQYSYDAVLRLTDAVGGMERHYSYDPAGNVTRIGNGSRSASIDFNALNQIETIDGTAYRYDANGNLLYDGVHTYKWDAANRLIEIHNIQTGHISRFAYDGFSRRVWQTEITPGAQPVTTQYLWCGRIICEKRDVKGGVLARYYPEGELQKGRQLYYARNQVGSVVAVVDAEGAIAGRLHYDPYGNIIQTSGTLPDFRYAGMFYHAASGLELATYRAYDPHTARWISRDPVREAGGINLYGYVGGNPVNRLDPTGRWFGLDDFVATVGGAVIGVVMQGVSDAIAGNYSGWEVYVGAAVGGAVSGEVALYGVAAGPWGVAAAGALGGGTADFATQFLKRYTGKQCTIHWNEIAFSAGVGALMGRFLPDFSISGVSVGRNSNRAILKQMIAKRLNGTAKSISWSTAKKMGSGLLLPGLPSEVVAAEVKGIIDGVRH